MLPISHILPEQELVSSFSVKHINNTIPAVSYSYRLSYHRVLYVERGKGKLQIDDLEYTLADQEIYLASKGQIFKLKAGSSLQAFEISFGDCFWEKAPASASNCKAVLFNNTAANQHIPLQAKDREELHPLFLLLLQESEKETYVNKPDALAAYLKVIMIKIANVNASLVNGYDNHENQLYRQFIELISQQYRESHEVADYARQMGITARKLTDLSKRCSGKGAKEIINGQLIAEAKRSLQFSSLPVKEIAYSLNFSSPEQFSHFFKKNTNISPVEYRTSFLQIGISC
ncbi:AraC family transcriptional regulator [Pedobacter antarcticus]|uniref:helix-turn-helix domain-containing protein n=1 Tax=Pedobacter antarcticus TaxID=34086 RepID=UPI00292F8A38|nr:AraC family transcriptional regulator [Pedobacter antarcticus]